MNNLNLELISLVVSLLALIVAVVALIFSGQLRKLRQMFGTAEQPDNLEEVLTSMADSLKKLRSDHSELSGLVNQQGQTLTTAFQYSSVMRFDSGSSDGGNLSFTIALLDGQQTGFIITSLHGRDHNRIYCKTIESGASQTQLSEEEQTVLIDALTQSTKNQTEKPTRKKVKSSLSS